MASNIPPLPHRVPSSATIIAVRFNDHESHDLPTVRTGRNVLSLKGGVDWNSHEDIGPSSELHPPLRRHAARRRAGPRPVDPGGGSLSPSWIVAHSMWLAFASSLGHLALPRIDTPRKPGSPSQSLCASPSSRSASMSTPRSTPCDNSGNYLEPSDGSRTSAAPSPPGETPTLGREVVGRGVWSEYGWQTWSWADESGGGQGPRDSRQAVTPKMVNSRSFEIPRCVRRTFVLPSCGNITRACMESESIT